MSEARALAGAELRIREELASLESIEELCAWIVKVLDAFLDEVLQLRGKQRDLPVSAKRSVILTSIFGKNLL